MICRVDVAIVVSVLLVTNDDDEDDAIVDVVVAIQFIKINEHFRMVSVWHALTLAFALALALISLNVKP